MQVMICDDEQKDIKTYENLMGEVADMENLDIKFDSCATGEQLLFYMEDLTKEIDVLLLDIHMPGINGIETALKLRQSPYNFDGEIVFVTKASSYAIAAFDTRAFHYIVKEVTPVEKIKTIFSEVLVKSHNKKEEFVLVKGIGEYRNISIQSIEYFEVVKRIIQVHYEEDEMFEFYSTMAKLEVTMMPKRFIRVHRSFLVSVDKVVGFTFKDVTMKSGVVIPVGRAYADNLKIAMQTVQL